MRCDFDSAASASQLLGNHRAGSPFFFASPRGTLLAQGVHSRVAGPATEPGDLPQRVARTLALARKSGHSNPAVVGAIPFDPATPAQLVVARTLHSAGRLSFDRPHQAPEPAAGDCAARMVPEPAEYRRGVETALERIAGGSPAKVVLSRTLELTSDTPISVERLLYNLARHNPQGYSFAVDLPGGRTLIGASPELLVSKSGRQVVANPLAGSAARSADPVEDQRRAEALLASAKDRHEHAVVADAVAAALRPYCRWLDVPAEPSLIQTRTLWHLSTEIRGELTDYATSSLTLASALHPTPAVCGHPTAEARALIGEVETFDRGFFTGMVGWCDAIGDGEWAVTIRCAEVEGHKLRLFAGAGIVAGSTPEKELAETGAKFRTMLNGMGIRHPVETA
ncbi:isochorismate synthase [Skermanella stibiiresistens SB22]|uniref:isochorismate synthase n=1 Tax=Skermanella stibiiresistens SB22 TaxID=1385369 RepID=W9H0S1_9PROT|nr:isochorismate synthase [Skermanella stibiiresistens SB22]